MKHRLALIFGLTALTALLFAADLTAGSSGMPLSAVLNALLAGPSGQSPEALILWSLRLPMTLTALFVGAALALAGLQIQTITANALASPSTLGITSGASFGAALAITAGFTVGGELWLGTMTASFLASLLICALILALGRLRGMTPTTLILAGIVMNFFFMALHQFLVYVASPEVAQLISGWTFGNLERAGWLSAACALGAVLLGTLLLAPKVWAPTTLILAGIVMNFFFMALHQFLVYVASPEVAQLISGWTFGNLERAGWLSAACALGAVLLGTLLLAPKVWALTTLSIGEERAKSLGIQVSRLRLLVFSTASVLIAASVSFIGTIAFVGLVAPHCAKLLLGDDQRFLMPASMLFGGAILLLSSLLSKFISTGAMLPVGIITSIVGVPFLFVLLLKNRRDY